MLAGHRRRVAAGLDGRSRRRRSLVRLVAVAAVTIAAVAVLNADRGVPLALLILVGFVVGFEYVAERTALRPPRLRRRRQRRGGAPGRHPRQPDPHRGLRARLHDGRVGGILAASRLLAVNQSSGGSDLLLLAIAGPVIAGTSLFGGRGSVWSALLGALVIGSISNGMDLLALDSAVKFMITGGVLLLAVIVDAVARQQRQAAGPDLASANEQRGADRAAEVAERGDADRGRALVDEEVLAHLLASAAPCSARRSARRGRRR